MKRIILLFLLITIFTLTQGNQADAVYDSADVNSSTAPLSITRVKPSGQEARVGRQVVITFNRPVVPIGKMERDSAEIPITITPNLNCEWRWVDRSNLACQLTGKNKIRPATRYTVTVKPGIKAEDGSTIRKTFTSQFQTILPKVTWVRMRNWERPGTPTFSVSFNMSVSRSSVRSHLYFKTETVDRMPVEIIKGGKEYETTYYIRPVGEMPADEDVKLYVEAGINSELGYLPGINNREIRKFSTFGEFKYIGLKCYNHSDKEVVVKPGGINFSKRCAPHNQIALRFSVPLQNDNVRNNITASTSLGADGEPESIKEYIYVNSDTSANHEKDRTYNISLQSYGTKPFTDYRVTDSDGGFRDIFDRPLKRPLDMAFLTDHYRPSWGVKSFFNVLEKGVDSDVALESMNIKSFSFEYDTLTIKEKRRDNFSFDVGAPIDNGYNVAAGARKMIGAGSGAMFATVNSSPKIPYSERGFMAQVTPFNIHVKYGHYKSLAWVTDYATGKPVQGATVKLYSDSPRYLKGPRSPYVSAITDKDGIATFGGTDEFGRARLRYYSTYNSKYDSFFVSAEKDGDIAMIPLSYNFQTTPRGPNGSYIATSTENKYGHRQAWGTTSQGVYKAGDTVKFKLYVRDQDNTSLVAADPRETYKLRVIDPRGQEVYKVNPLKLSEFGSYNGEFTVPATGAVGWYSFRLNDGDQTLYPLQVLIGDFTPSPFKASTILNGELFRNGETLEVLTTGRLHSGGPYTDADTRVTVVIRGNALIPSSPRAKGFKFDTMRRHYRSSETVSQKQVKLDGNGDNTQKVKLPVDSEYVYYGKLFVESAISDDRGKSVASSASANFAARDRYVGLHLKKSWGHEKGEVSEVEAVVVDELGKMTKGSEMNIAVKLKKVTAARVKSAGNAYTTRYSSSWETVETCKIKSSDVTPSVCKFTPPEAGRYEIVATVRDTAHREHTTRTSFWAGGDGYVMFERPDDSSLNIIPQSETLKIGDTARYMVLNPYPGSKALITVERYGVITSRVADFNKSIEMVEIPVTEEMIPGYYMSIVIMTPRVDKPIDDKGVDLGKPSFTMGYVKTTVNDPFKMLDVKVTARKDEYRPREKVKVKVKVSSKRASHNEPVELAITVIDESVFALIQGGMRYFDPYKGLYNLESLDLQNFNMIMQLVGRQKFDKKGANAGGDGGDDVGLRSLFTFVAYWNPSMKVDKKGMAEFEFDAPDNLTGWRVLVLAATPTDQLGLGRGNFKVNRPTEVRPILPNQVTEGDSFMAGFTVMNRTKKPRTIKVKITASGVVKGGKVSTTQTVDVAPYKRQKVWLPVKSIDDGEIEFTAKAWDSIDKDGMKTTMPVRKYASLVTAANYGTTTSAKVTESIEFPEEIRTDTGSVSVVATSTVIGSIEGAFEYMRNYPYMCWEQKLTKGTMASHFIELKDYLPGNLTWKASKGLAQKTLKLAADFQSPSGGMCYYTPIDKYANPYLSAYTALSFNWLKKSGHRVPSSVQDKLHSYLLNLLRNDAMPSYYSSGMSSTVRAVALAALSEHGKISLSDLKRYRPHLKDMSLFGKAHYMQALMNVRGTDKMRKEVANLILSHSNQTGGKFIFSESLDDGYSRILGSSLRTNCAILSAMLKYGETRAGAPLVGDVPFKMVRTITQSRQNKTHWESTQENMFCMNALIEYSRLYEKDTPNFKVTASLDKKKFGEAKFKSFRDKPALMERSIKEGDSGRKAELILNKKGPGRLYYAARLSYAPLKPTTEPINAGIEVHREYSVKRGGKWELLGNAFELTPGELVRVDIFVSLPAARNYVVVDDHVPGGLEPVNRDLATSSTLDADEGEFQRSGASFWYRYDGWLEYDYSYWSFYHKELRHHAVQFYSEYLPAGRYHLAYTAQVIAPGEFTIMPTHAEEMYDPDVFGKSTPASLTVKEKAEK